ncbi:MAG: hypothetical protein ACYT04_34620, partial [Nostoc sp.]
KRIVSRRVAQDTKRPCFNPTFLNVGSLLPSASCLLPSETMTVSIFVHLVTKLQSSNSESERSPLRY